MRMGLGFGMDVGMQAQSGADLDFNYPMLALPYSLQRLGFTYVRNSLKTASQNDALVTLAANQFGTTYDSVTGLHAFEAEPAATNLALNSILAGGGAAPTSWTQGIATGTSAPVASLFGGASGAIAYLQSALATERPWIQQAATLSANTTYVASVVVESVTGSPTVGDAIYSGTLPSGTRTFYLNGNLVTSSDPLVTGVVTMRIAIGATGGSVAARIGVGSAGSPAGAMSVQFSRPQFESGPRRTSWIATTTGTVTRAADVLSTATANLPGFNAAGYTLAVDFRKDIAGSVATVALEVDDNSANNRAFIGCDSTNTVSTFTRSGGVTQASVVEVAFSTLRQRAAYSNSVNSFLRAVSGTAGTSDSLGAMPVSPTHLFVGCRFAGADQLNGFIYSFKLIPVALNQAQTTALTS